VCLAGVFLACWFPFFTLNIINAICIRYDLHSTSAACDVHPALFSFLVWLGYINSFLNPVIYTVFNAEFRRAFRNLLTPGSSRRRGLHGAQTMSPSRRRRTANRLATAHVWTSVSCIKAWHNRTNAASKGVGWSPSIAARKDKTTLTKIIQLFIYLFINTDTIL